MKPTIYPSCISVVLSRNKNFLLSIFASLLLTLFSTSAALAQLTVDAGADIAVCQGNTVTLGGSPTASGGTPPYTYAWSNVQGISSTTVANPTLTVQSTSWIYVTVTDAGQNTAMDSIMITRWSLPNAFVFPSDTFVCIGDSVHIFIAQVGGGSPPYNFLYDFNDGAPAGGSNFHFYVVPGTYFPTFQITDANGCSRTVPVQQISVFPNPVANAGVDVTRCLGDTTTLGGTPTASGGSGPYNYTWTPSAGLMNPVSPNPTAFVQTSTTYSVTVSDLWGCTATDAVSVFVQNCTSAFQASVTHATCFGQCNGTAAINPQGNYRYLWSSSDTSRTVNGLCAGTYSVTVMDSVLIPLDTVEVSISQPAIITVFTNVNPVTCFGGMDGSIFLSVTGGTPPYTFTWNNGSTTQQQNNLVAGTYSVTITDANGCTASANATVTQPPPLTVTLSATNVSAPGACDGAITATVSGGTPPYTYVWSNGALTQSITGLCAGFYNITVVDANGCTGAGSAAVLDTCLNNTMTLSISSTGDIDCGRTADTLTAVVAGGTSPYSFLWSNGANTQTIITSQAGVYTAYVSDNGGCSRVATDTVDNLGIIISLVSSTPASCNGVVNGRIQTAVSGGTPPYTFLWSNGGITDSLLNVPPGNYVLIVTDAALCTAAFSYSVNQSSTNWSYYVYLSGTAPNCSSNGTVTASVYGGTGPFTYAWNTIPSPDTSFISGLAAGTYMVTVTGSNGCSRTGQITLIANCANYITGYLYSDANGNCQYDVGENLQSGQQIAATNGTNTFYGTANSTGYFSIRIPMQGTFTVRPSFYNSTCALVSFCSVDTVTFPSLGDTATTYLGYQTSSGFDLSIHPGWTSANPGFQKNYWIYFKQAIPATFTGTATVTFTYDPILQFNGCSQGCTHNVANHTLVWNVNNVSTNWLTGSNRYEASFTVPANTPIGYPLTQQFSIEPITGDCRPTNNTFSATQPVTGSMDPNAKEVSPVADIVEDDSVLTYTIHFQNTGNDTTAFVILKDTLSQHLDPATVHNVASSHEYTSFEVTDHGVLTWLFNPIFLVDSATNEEASKGFVMFTVKKKPNLPIGTQIDNKASIYFDYNEPIVTNTVTNTITDPTYVFAIREDDISVTAMPNPFSESTRFLVQGVNGAFRFELFDVTGKLLRSVPSIQDNLFELKRDDMSAGIYFYRISTTAGQRAHGRLVVE